MAVGDGRDDIGHCPLSRLRLLRPLLQALAAATWPAWDFLCRTHGTRRQWATAVMTLAATPLASNQEQLHWCRRRLQSHLAAHLDCGNAKGQAAKHWPDIAFVRTSSPAHLTARTPADRSQGPCRYRMCPWLITHLDGDDRMSRPMALVLLPPSSRLIHSIDGDHTDGLAAGHNCR